MREQTERFLSEHGKIRLGIAPIAWTNDDMPDLGRENTFAQCISEMALAGFTGTEVGNRYPKDPTALKKELELRGLVICSQWFSSYLISRPFEEVREALERQLSFLEKLGTKTVGVSEQSHSLQGWAAAPLFGKRYAMSSEEWDLLCRGLDALGKMALEQHGISLTYHHHMGTVVQTAEETRRLLAHTDPAFVNLLLDTGHFACCGEEPAALLREFAGRVRHIHLKDVRPEVVEQVKREKESFLTGVRAGMFTIPGDGCVDFDTVFREIGGMKYEGWLVVEAEQDPARANPLEYALRARTYLREHAGL